MQEDGTSSEGRRPERATHESRVAERTFGHALPHGTLLRDLAWCAVPTMPAHFTAEDRALSGRDRFLKRLENRDEAARAEIAVERIGGRS